jgi:SAM-dependent methyltransferase
MNITNSMKEPKSWKPDRPTSRGATEFHEAVINASWNHACLDELISISKPRIKEDDTIVDYGAGTGTSAIRILEKLGVKIKLWLVDNSPAWLGKAYESLKPNPNTKFFVLGKNNNFATLAETIGNNSVDHVFSANTVHLIPNLKETFKGILDAIRPNGLFIFNSGNIIREGKPEGALMLDSTVYRVHDIALQITKRDPKFKKYRKDLYRKIEATLPQRKFVFHYPRDIKEYLAALKDSGFMQVKAYYKLIKVKYEDYLKFLRVRRLQAGMLPEIGGTNPNAQEESDRDTLITMASLKFFEELKQNNPLADDKSFVGEWAFVSAVKH